ncbi:hypothetical protein QBC37DRAFT_329629 [Rhypophila decipiens]|uniref:Uncharacterized protein n=1 Tax=Rhypophila decipiens TaxID=261697 RepID=A0AAN6XYC6_9PEZI|nr:hypothetical protein QBC37DRAFT_329629 [Rhypophila decipiens]
MFCKPAALVPSLLYVGATIVLLSFSCKILANKENQKEGLVILSLSLGNTRRDLLGSVQTIAGEATNVGAITTVAGGVPSQAIAAASSVISDAAVGGSVVGKIFAANYTVGTKYACAASSCDKIPSLEVVLCFGLLVTVMAAIAFTLAFFLPFMKFVSLGCSLLSLLFFIVFAACAVSIVEVASLVGGSTSFRVERGEVFKESLWALGGAVLLAFSAVGRLFVSTRQAGPVAGEQSNGSSRVVPTWAQPARSGRGKIANAKSEKGSD